MAGRPCFQYRSSREKMSGSKRRERKWSGRAKSSAENSEGKPNPGVEGGGSGVPGETFLLDLGSGTEECSQEQPFPHTSRCRRQNGTRSTQFWSRKETACPRSNTSVIWMGWKAWHLVKFHQEGNR